MNKHVFTNHTDTAAAAIFFFFFFLKRSPPQRVHLSRVFFFMWNRPQTAAANSKGCLHGLQLDAAVSLDWSQTKKWWEKKKNPVVVEITHTTTCFNGFSSLMWSTRQNSLDVLFKHLNNVIFQKLSVWSTRCPQVSKLSPILFVFCAC